VHTAQHVSGIIFREIKLYERKPNIPILDGLDCIKPVGIAISWIGIDGGGLVNFGNDG
jgi:hypothetical protein